MPDSEPLAGGNPRIAKGDGDAPVQAYIAAMPGWKHEVGRRLDALIERTVPGVRKAVKWNTPLYGVDGRSWFLGYHCVTRYVKLAFFHGSALDPPGVGTARLDTRKMNGETMTDNAKTPSQLIDERIEMLGDWRGETLARLRALIKAAIPDVVEEWKWRGVPTWYKDGMLFTGETYKSVVKMTFAKGAKLADPTGLFNSSLEGNVRRAIDFHEGEAIDEVALKALFRAAAALNEGKG